MRDTSLTALPPDMSPGRLCVPAEQLRPSQAEAFDVAMQRGARLRVFGGPRSGKTTVAMSLADHVSARAAMSAGEFTAGHNPAVIVVTASRARSARLRDALTASAISRRALSRQDRSETHEGRAAVLPMVATPTALAFSIVNAAQAASHGAPPTLVTGAQQDAIIASILAQDAHVFDQVAPARALSMPGFRTEVRDVLARALERGLGAQELRELGLSKRRREWVAAAHVMQMYLRVLALESTTAIDSNVRLDGGMLMTRAIRDLQQGHVGVRPRLLVVDDMQDVTWAGIRLVEALAAVSERVMLTSTPDAAVEGFRGALADAATRVELGDQARSMVLTEAPAMRPEVARAVQRMRGQLPLAGAPAAVREDPPSAEAQAISALSAHVSDSDESEAVAIASAIRALMTEHGESPDEIAVVCRSSGQARQLAQRLGRQGVSARATAVSVPLREERVVHDLFLILEAAREGRRLSEDEVLSLLRGPWADADDMRIRKIRRLLVAQADHQQGDLDGGVLVRAFERSTPIPAISTGEQALLAPLERVRRMREAASESSGIHRGLWVAWEASGRQASWREAALADATAAERDTARVMNARIDAVSALMNAADRYEEREGGEDLGVFIAQVRSMSVAEDSLSPRAHVRGSVAVMTPAGIAGREYSSVIIASLNEGTWPNARIRSTLLGATDLALVWDHPDLPSEPTVIRRIQREAVIADEVRMAVAAMSRARNRVLVSAVHNASARPSALFTLVRGCITGPTWMDSVVRVEAPGPFPSARELIASIARARAHGVGGSESAELGSLLESLQAAGIDGADCATWYHRPASTRGPVFEPHHEISLGPSALETVQQCPRAYILERAGAARSPGRAQSLGTLVHRIAQELPTADAATLIRRFDDLAPASENPSWVQRAERERALSMMEKLGSYQGARAEPVALEHAFSTRVGNIRLRGVIDRIEPDPADPAGGVRVVDYKTGAHAISARAAERNLQLGAYQHALAHGDAGDIDVTVTGATLVYLGTTTQSFTERHQGAIEDCEEPGWFTDAVAHIDARLRAWPLTLVRNEHCTVCPVKSSCPLFEQGRQL